MFFQAEKNVCSREAKIGPADLLDIDARDSSEWPYKKAVAATVAKLWQLVQ